MIRMYGFVDDDFIEESVASDDKEILVLCQCGATLLHLIMDKTEDAKSAIGLTSNAYHDLYRAHCAEQHRGDSFIIEWVDDPSKLPGFPQPDPTIEVLPWTRDDLTSLAHRLRTVLPADQEHTSPKDDH